MNRRFVAFALSALLPLAATAQPQTAPAPMPPAMTAPATHGYMARLEKMLRQSKEQSRRVVVMIGYQEIAGVVLDLGPGWVVLSNQKDQEILLQTNAIERAEFR